MNPLVSKGPERSPPFTSTGATGYIGGDTLYALHNKHPEWTYTALVRTKEKGSKVQDAYPNVHLVYGDLDDYDVIKEQATKADIVIRKSLHQPTRLERLTELNRHGRCI